MIIMTMLGIGMFLGFNMEWTSIERNTTVFFESSGFADYRILSEEGFTQEDVDKILTLPGTEKAALYLSVNADVTGTQNTLAVTVTQDPEVSGFVVMEGAPYDPADEEGLWLFDKYARENGIHIGDTLELEYESLKIRGTVKALIESGEYLICVRDETQLMPTFDTFGYVYISPAALNACMPDMPAAFVENIMSRLYHQINVISTLDKQEFREAVNNLFGKTMVVVSKDETISYAQANGEVQEGKTMGSILPVLFLLISILTMITTMHRIAVNEKTQIGTLKALGFKNARIMRHYCTYSLMTGLLGTILGIGLGYFVAWFIMNPNGMMGTYLAMPEWNLYIPWWCWLVMVCVILLITLTGGISIKNMLHGSAADALRPYVPKLSRRLFIEKTRLRDSLRFGTKWNLRDILRHKSRSIVTLIGVLGCMVLMVAAIGMKETAAAFIKTTYTDNAGYASKIFLADSAGGEEAAALSEEYDGDYGSTLSIQIAGETYAADVYHLRKNLVRFTDQDNRPIELPDDGILVCLRLQQEYQLQVGDELTFSLFGTDEEYTATIAGFYRSMSEGIAMSELYAKSLMNQRADAGHSLTESDMYRPSYVFTQAQKPEIPLKDGISSVQSKQDIEDSMNSFMDVLNTAVAILVAGAVLLGIVVLYNLGVMSYMERYREMATLKVVGFKDKRIRGLLIGQNLWITVVGIVLGLFAGIGVLTILMKALASEFEMKVVIGLPTILISIAVTMAVSILVGLMVSRKSAGIDMVAALKTPE